LNSQEKSKYQKLSIRSRRVILAFCGVFVNVLLSFLMYKMGFPMFLDSIGTLCVAAITGFLFPSICTAVASTVICALFHESYIYLSFFNAFIAIVSVAFIRKYSFRNIGRTILYVLGVAFFSSLVISIAQYAFYGQQVPSLVAQNVRSFSSTAPIPWLLSFSLTNFLLYFLEKSFICIFVIILQTIIPKEFINSFEDATWKQRFISNTSQQYISDRKNDMKHPLHTRFALYFIITSTILVFLTCAIAIRLYSQNSKRERTENALKCVRIAAEFIDSSKVKDFIKFGKNAPGYKKTQSLLYKTWEVSSVTYLSVVKNEEAGARFIFNVDNHQNIASPVEFGKIIPYSKEFIPFKEDLLAGKQIRPVETNSFFNRHIIVSCPIFDDNGKCVCYVVAGTALNYLPKQLARFVLKVLLIIAGFFLVIISFTIWTIGTSMSYPISAMATCISLFSDSVEEQEKLDENVRQIRSLDIQSGDEIQKLYDAICQLTLNQTEQVRDIRRLSDSTMTMQDGLIITMADMVENRDSDTGAHVQKTSAYVKIIVEGLKKKEYYASKITQKFMSDVVRSAPLHDVGKINIPDNVLNKPGKLTDEEFAIMKTHTTAGKQILEKAISTVQGENYLKEARNMAAYHHERWDGKGYPEGLHGEVIPLSARIMAVADVFDALTSPRVYKPAFPFEKALAILKEGAGSQFDPKCVEVFMESLSEVKVILKKYNPTTQT
jgi:HD-GYP domain-containing protein (c-di-GMP phosphodiesterase class II)